MEGFKSFNKDIDNIFESIADIDELIRAAKDKCQKLTNIIEGTNLGTWEWDIQKDEILVNEQWAKMLGYTLEEIQPQNFENWKTFSHHKDLSLAKIKLNKYLNGDTSYYESEIRLRHKNGKWIWVHDKGKITKRDKDGNPIKMFGTHSDITIRKEAEKKLKENEKRFLLALNVTEAGLWDIDMVNKTMYLSPMWKTILGYKDHEIENSFEAWVNLWHPDDSDIIIKALNDHIDAKTKHYNVIHRLKHKDGNWYWILSRGKILRDSNNRPYRWIGTHIDITEKHEQSLELERFFTINLDLLCLLDMNGNFLKVNKAWEDILGHTRDELNGTNVVNFLHKEDIKKTISVLQDLKSGKKFVHIVNRILNKDKKYMYIEWRVNSYEDVIYVSGRDITERVEYERKILDMSNRDALTNAYNRRHIFDRAKEIIEEYKRIKKIFSISIIDIDNFKDINDNYGHQAGDYILKSFTEVIDENLRPYDLLGRYGGEEFILILNNINRKESSLVVGRILNIIRNKTFNFDGQDINLTFSAGISSCTEMEKNKILIDDLVKIADQRMYYAKKTGKNKVVFEM
ncbi:MAG: sensor domain-containing diguanylate cyclase [Tissierella sp.]|uniref:sensor domain-containing diguanylate cyclase n=1 Tax=Tissierella sp. TaxID=41274 RepID=UPI003F980F64